MTRGVGPCRGGARGERGEGGDFVAYHNFSFFKLLRSSSAGWAEAKART